MIKILLKHYHAYIVAKVNITDQKNITKYRYNLFSVYKDITGVQAHLKYCTKKIIFKCCYCTNVCKTYRKLKLHLKKHKQYDCPWCNEKFKKKYVYTISFLLLNCDVFF